MNNTYVISTTTVRTLKMLLNTTTLFALSLYTVLSFQKRPHQLKTTPKYTIIS